ncbi:ROK family transcriptional regulator, partial [Marinomonas arenicola]
QVSYGLGINVDRDRFSAALLVFSGHCVVSLEQLVSFPTEQMAKEIALRLLREVNVRLLGDWAKVQGVG